MISYFSFYTIILQSYNNLHFMKLTPKQTTFSTQQEHFCKYSRQRKHSSTVKIEYNNYKNVFVAEKVVWFGVSFHKCKIFV